MINVNAATKNAYLKDSSHKVLTVSIPELNIELVNKDYSQGTMEYTESVVAGESIEFVGCIASVFSITVHNVFTDISNKRIVVSIKADNTQSVPLFTGYIDKVEQVPHKREKRITAYDALYKLSDVNVANWYNTLSFPQTIKSFRDSLFEHLGIIQVSTTLVNDSVSFNKDYQPTELSALDVIKAICQINCVFGRITRAGSFEYVTPPSLTVGQEIDHYKPNSTDYQEYLVKPVDNLIIRRVNDDFAYGGGSNKYIIQNNFFINSLSESTLRLMAQNLYDLVHGFSYQPFNADVNGLPYLQCLDVVSLPVYPVDGSSDTPVVTPFMVLERTMKGVQALRDNLIAEGDEYQHEFVTDVSVDIEQLKQQMEIIRNDMDNLKFAYYLLTNTEDIDISNTETKTIIDMYFVAKAESVVTFNCEILCNVETEEYYDAIGKITYYMDEQEIGGFYPTETWLDGKHILNLYYYFVVQTATRKRLRVTLNMSGGSVHINTTNLKGAIYGQNLVASDMWDGILTIDDTVERVIIPTIPFRENVEDVAYADVQVPVEISHSDIPSRSSIPKIEVFRSANDTVFATTHTDSKPIATETGDIIITQEGDTIYTEGD